MDTQTKAPPMAILLRHCRCMDCTRFSQVGGSYFCSEHIGGTSVRWSDGQRQCDPPPEAWHYCACYDGPQVSKDVWVWPRTPRHVGARSTIAQDVEQADEDEVLIPTGANVTGGNVGKIA